MSVKSFGFAVLAAGIFSLNSSDYNVSQNHRKTDRLLSLNAGSDQARDRVCFAVLYKNPEMLNLESTRVVMIVPIV